MTRFNYNDCNAINLVAFKSDKITIRSHTFLNEIGCLTKSSHQKFAPLASVEKNADSEVLLRRAFGLFGVFFGVIGRGKIQPPR